MIILAAAVIISLSNSGIIGKANEAVNETNLKQVQTIATTIWVESQHPKLDSTTIKNKIIAAIGEDVANNYDIQVDENGVTVTINNNGGEDEEEVPDKWAENVTAMVKGVPIPKGFVASSVEGENTKDAGLVIYEGNDPVTDANVEEAKKSRNQYVWVPVEYENFTRDLFDIDHKTVYKEEADAEIDVALVNTLGTDTDSAYGLWEVELDTTTNIPLPSQSTMTYMSDYTLLEVQEMYESVKEYGGFYIARYEAGVGTVRNAESDLVEGTANVYSVMGKYPYDYIPWSNLETMNVDEGGAVQVARSLYPDDDSNTTGVISTLTYGVQWDSALKWIKEKNPSIDLTNSTAYGNHLDTEIIAGEINKDAEYAIYNLATYELGSYDDVDYDEDEKSTTEKTNEQAYLFTTGALEKANKNNIYDLAGNAIEWTMEGSSASIRVSRGGLFYSPGVVSVAVRGISYPTDSNDGISFRPSLYIKK